MKKVYCNFKTEKFSPVNGFDNVKDTPSTRTNKAKKIFNFILEFYDQT